MRRKAGYNEYERDGGRNRYGVLTSTPSSVWWCTVEGKKSRSPEDRAFSKRSASDATISVCAAIADADVLVLVLEEGLLEVDESKRWYLCAGIEISALGLVLAQVGPEVHAIVLTEPVADAQQASEDKPVDVRGIRRA